MKVPGFSYDNPEQIFREITSLTPICAGMTYRRLEPFGLMWPCPEPDHPGTEYLHKGQFARGKAKFFPVTYRPVPEQPDSQYPFVLLTGRMLFHFHTGTMTRRSPALQAEVPHAYAELSPQDASRLKVKDGDLLLLQSRRGSITTPVRVSPRVPSGCIFIPFHFAESPANALTLAELDPVAKIPELKVCALRATPVRNSGGS
jgi:predicted molibdopterin-dependent oxidoreductase YjgC